MRKLVITVLAWLGLAGLSDAMVEWHSWFDQGVIQHWISVKEWTKAVLFFWVPVDFSTAFFDYLILGGITVRSLHKPEFARSADLEKQMSQRLRQIDYIASVLFISAPKRAIVLLFWPLYVVNEVYIFFVEAKNFPDDERPKVIKENRDFLKMVLWCLFGFLPFLFVVSNLLYEFG